MNQLFYNIAGGIVHQIRREKRTAISEVIVRGKWNITEAKFPLFFSFSASFKNSNPREKVAKLSSFWDWWAESLLISIIVAKYKIFPRANNGRSHDKQNISDEAICSRYQRALSGFWARLRILNVIGLARALCYNNNWYKSTSILSQLPFSDWLCYVLIIFSVLVLS